MHTHIYIDVCVHVHAIVALVCPLLPNKTIATTSNTPIMWEEEKSPLDNRQYDRSKGAKRTMFLALLAVVAIYLGLCTNYLDFNSWGIDLGSDAGQFQCPTYEKISGKPADAVSQLVHNDVGLRNATIQKLINAVRIPTVITDNYPNPEDQPDFEGWQPFVQLHKQLAADFPAIWKHLKVEVVNKYSLLLTWEGSDASLKPNMFAAHQDVVPIDESSLAQWEHPPFSGDFDGKYIWGRGSIDDKNMLIGMLQSVEYILTNEPDFQPKRTLILALGADEEAFGRYGAGYIGEVLEERYGVDGIYSIVDEGGNGINNIADVWIASPATGEKGYMDLEVLVTSPGGHSSIPPDHTSIGIAAEIIHEIEGELFPTLFTPDNPVTEFFQCLIQNSKVIDPSTKRDFADAFNSVAANQRVLNFISKVGGRLADYLLSTSQAVDVIQGGVKANALPETATFIVNTRIMVESSVNATIDKIARHGSVVAERFGLGLTVLDQEIIPATPAGSIVMTTLNTLEPAPVSPSNKVWGEFAGTIKGFFENVVFPERLGKDNIDLVVAPSIMTANTDTWHYWSLTKNIYRFQPAIVDMGLVSHIHAVNEHIDLESLMYAFGFFYEYIHVLNQ